MNTLPSHITNALTKPIDYSHTFTDKVENLKNSLSSLFHLPIKHDSGMDYASGQFLSFTLDGEDITHSRKKYLFEVRFYISSKGPLFATYIFDQKRSVASDSELGHPIEISRLPESVQTVVNRVREFFQNEGYIEVEHQLFRVNAPDCKTQLDDLPASIFEALFAEIV